MTKKRKGNTATRLPRLTVLAWSKRELAAFVLAVEMLGHHVRDLGELVDRMKVKRPRPATTSPTEENGTMADRGN